MSERRLSFVQGCYFDGRGRDRCETTNKIAYASECEAVEAAAARRFFVKEDLRLYWDDNCLDWHLTSKTCQRRLNSVHFRRLRFEPPSSI